MQTLQIIGVAAQGVPLLLMLFVGIKNRKTLLNHA